MLEATTIVGVGAVEWIVGFIISVSLFVLAGWLLLVVYKIVNKHIDRHI